MTLEQMLAFLLIFLIAMLALLMAQLGDDDQ
jgi:hypothetical protein